MPTAALGLSTEADSVQPLTRHHRRTLGEVLDEAFPLPITLVKPFNGGFVNRDDITGENGYLPMVNLLSANIEPGEHANGLVATLWWEWTSGEVDQPDMTWSFDWAGHSGAGGAGIRLYSNDNDPDVPSASELLASDDQNGAAGMVSITFSPAPSTTYYLQTGIKEKAGTVSSLLQLRTTPPGPTFAAVIP